MRSTKSRRTALFAAPKVSDEEMEQRKEQLRDLLCATETEIDKLARKNPSVFSRRDVVLAHRPKVALLQERLGISRKAAGKLCLGANSLLNFLLATLEGKIDWLQARLHLDKADLWKVIKRSPVILTCSTEDNLEPTINNIQSSLELSDKELTKMIVWAPDLLLHNFSDDLLASRFVFLQDVLNIDEEDIASLRAATFKKPEILFWSEESMLESQQWIKNRFGYGDSKVAQVCRLYPHTLTSNIDTLEKMTSDLQIELALDNDELERVISNTPSLLSSSINENIKPKMDFFQRTFALDAEEVKTLLLRHSVLLKLSIAKNVEPKIEFYSKLAGKAVAKEAIFENPNLLLQSFKKRLKPRLAEIVESGDKVRWSKTLLFRMALRTPAQWEKYGLGEAPKGRSRKE